MSKNSSGTIIDWDYMDAFKSGKYWMYAEETSSGVWEVTGNDLKQSVGVNYECYKFWTAGTAVSELPCSIGRGLEAYAEQFSTATSANLIAAGSTVTGGPISSGSLAVGDSGGWVEWSYKEWDLGVDPTEGVTYTFNMCYSDLSTDTVTAVLAPFTPMADLSTWTLNTFLPSEPVSGSTVTATWTPPDLDYDMGEIFVRLCCSDESEDGLGIEPGSTSVTLSTAGLTAGTHYFEVIYKDVYGNEYELGKFFVFSP